MELTVVNQQKKIKLNPSRIRTILKAILRHERISEGSLSVVFVTAPKIRAFNRKYLKKNYSTDVLAFDFSEPQKSKKKNTLYGDIIISTDAAIKNSRIYNTTPRQELVRYMAHGILHLTGYDDHHPNDIERMKHREQFILDAVNAAINGIVLKRES